MAKAENAAQSAAAKTFNLETLLKSTRINLSNEIIEGQFQNSKVKAATPKDIERVSTGQVNSALRVGEMFRLVGVKMIEQDVRGTKRDLMLLIVENPAGDQRAIYSSSLFRSNPTASSDNNQYTQDVLDFDRGILQGLNGVGAPKMLEKLYGNGEDFIVVKDEITYVTNAVRQVDGNPALNEKAGDKFEIPNRVFRLEHISETEARATA